MFELTPVSVYLIISFFFILANIIYSSIKGYKASIIIYLVSCGILSAVIMAMILNWVQNSWPNVGWGIVIVITIINIFGMIFGHSYSSSKNKN